MLMRRLLVLSAACAALAGCPGPSCGPPPGTPLTLSITAGSATLVFNNFTSSANNDCTAPDAPSGVVSLEIDSKQNGVSGLSLCVARPDLLGTSPQEIGTGVLVEGFFGNDGTCTYALDNSAPPTGTVSGKGVCGNGTDPAGYALVLAGSATLTRTCGTSIDTVQVAIDGTVAVAAI